MKETAHHSLNQHRHATWKSKVIDELTIDGDLDEGARLGEAVNDLVGCVVDGWDVGVSVVGD